MMGTRNTRYAKPQEIHQGNTVDFKKLTDMASISDRTSPKFNPTTDVREPLSTHGTSEHKSTHVKVQDIVTSENNVWNSLW